MTTASADYETLVTVVIPARNEERFIGGCLSSVRGQSYENLQILVIDGDSDDRTAEIVRASAETDARVELLTNPRRVIPVSLNLGAREARGRWIVRIDAHASVPPDYVERAVEHLRTGGWGGVGGRKDGVGVTSAGQAIAVAMGSRFGVGNSIYHHGEHVQTVEHIPFGCYPVELVRELGGWDEQLLVNQDYEFDHRVRVAGHQLLFDPALRIDWYCRQSLHQLYRQYRRYGRGKAWVVRLHPRSARLRQVAPAGLVAVLGLAAVSAMKRPGVSVALTVPYIAFVAVGTISENRRLSGLAAKLRLPGAFAAMHLGWGVGLWQGAAELIREDITNRGTTPKPS